MSEQFVQAIRIEEIAPGGMRAVNVGGREIVVCNQRGTFYAVARRCGHMNAPLEQGTLDGSIVTCAMHCAQFDAATGQVLSGPVPPYLGTEALPPRVAGRLRNIDTLMHHIRTEPVQTYPVKVEAGWVLVAV